MLGQQTNSKRFVKQVERYGKIAQDSRVKHTVRINKILNYLNYRVLETDMEFPVTKIYL